MALYIPDDDRSKEILDGVIDLHCHAGPCIYGKEFDEIQTARMMRSVGYRGVLFKQHVMGANRIEFVRQAVPGIEVFGSIALNNYTGGLNPFSVAAAIIFGARAVKFPNIHAAHHRKVFGTPTYADIPSTAGDEMEARIAAMTPEGITIFDENGKIKDEVHEILQLIAEADIGVETGHLSPKEALALVKEAKKKGVRRVWQTHGNWKALYDYTGSQLSEIADAGAYIELTANCSYPSVSQLDPDFGPAYTAMIIKEVGAHRCTMGSDLGTVGRGNPVEGMRVFIHTLMIQKGIKREDINVMAKENPAYLMGLE